MSDVIKEFSIVYICNISCVKKEEVINFVSVERRKRIDIFRKEEDQVRSCVGELLLFYALKNILNINSQDVKILRNSRGKPFVQGISNFNFNISHAGEWVACAVSNRSVGIDIEEIKERQIEMFEAVFSTSEIQMIYGCKTKTQKESITILWTLKESYSKLIGHGLRMDFKDIQFKLINKKLLMYINNFLEKEIQFSVYKIDENYICSVVSNKKQKPKIELLSYMDLVSI